jgi:hypothetical protein
MQQLLLIDPERATRVEIRLPPRNSLTLDVRAANYVQRPFRIGSREEPAALLRIALARVLENLEQELSRQLGRLGVRVARRRGATG